MWYRNIGWVRYAGTREEFLRSLGVTDDVIDYVSQQDALAANVYTSALKKNPQMPLGELQQLPISTEKPKDDHFSQLKQEFDNTFSRLTTARDPVFKRWLGVQAWKMYRQSLSDGDMPYMPVFVTSRNAKSEEVFDWYLAEVRRLGDRFSLSSFSFPQAVKRSDEWHRVQAGRGAGVMYEPMKDEHVAYRFSGENQGWTVQLVKGENDLTVEGNKQSHCVGSYCEDVEEGRKIIYSLRDPFNNPHVTIEMTGSNGNTVSQIRAHANTEPADNLKALIKEWLKTVPGAHWNGSSVDFDGYDYSEYDVAIKQWWMDGDEYGITGDITRPGLVIDLYDEILKNYQNRYFNHNGRYTRHMENVPPTLARLAVESDKEFLKQFISFGGQMSYKNWLDRSQVHLLKGRCEHELDELTQSIHSNMFENDHDFGAPAEPYEHEYDTQEEYLEAYKEWEEEYTESVERAEQDAFDYQFDEGLEYLPYGFADDIRDELQKLEADEEYKQLLSKCVTPAES
jgi:hypothetical protein